MKPNKPRPPTYCPMRDCITFCAECHKPIWDDCGCKGKFNHSAELKAKLRYPTSEDFNKPHISTEVNL